MERSCGFQDLRDEFDVFQTPFCCSFHWWRRRKPGKYHFTQREKHFTPKVKFSREKWCTVRAHSSSFTCLRRGVISTREDIGCCCCWPSNERSADEIASSWSWLGVKEGMLLNCCLDMPVYCCCCFRYTKGKKNKNRKIRSWHAGNNLQKKPF